MKRRKLSRHEEEARALLRVQQALSALYRHPDVRYDTVQRVLAQASMAWRDLKVRIVVEGQ